MELKMMSIRSRLLEQLELLKFLQLLEQLELLRLLEAPWSRCSADSVAKPKLAAIL